MSDYELVGRYNGPVDLYNESVKVGTTVAHDGVATFYTAPNVGARLSGDTLCTRCGQRFQAGDVMRAVCAPDMAGTWHHTNCADPKLESVNGRNNQ